MMPFDYFPSEAGKVTKGLTDKIKNDAFYSLPVVN